MLHVLKIVFEYEKVSIRKQVFTCFDINNNPILSIKSKIGIKSLTVGLTFFMSHPAKKRFPISTFLYLNKICRTNGYSLHIQNL